MEYLDLLKELGISPEEARAPVEDTSDLIDFPTPYNVEVKESAIEGLGLFAVSDFDYGTLVAPARLGGMRTPAGRYTNHSATPNLTLITSDSDIFFIAKVDIKSGEELTVDYREVIELNTKLALKQDYHARMDKFEYAIARMPQVEIPTTHRFIAGPGMYVREAFAKAGTLLTSKIHTTNHPFVMLKGDQSIMDEDGSWIRIKAPFMGVTKAGSRRVVYAHTDTVMVSFHATEETDLNKVEEEIFACHDEHLGLELDKLQEIRALQRGPESRIIKGELT